MSPWVRVISGNISGNPVQKAVHGFWQAWGWLAAFKVSAYFGNRLDLDVTVRRARENPDEFFENPKRSL